jgi:hypothetical protein
MNDVKIAYYARIVIAVLLMTASVTLLPVDEASASNESIRLSMDGELITMNPPAYLENDIVYAPIRPVLARWGMELTWNPDTGAAIASNRYAQVRITLGSPYVNSDGRIVQLESSPLIRDGAMFVPIHSLAAVLGAETVWSSKLKTLYIQSGIQMQLGKLIEDQEALTYDGDTYLGMKHGYGRWFADGSLFYEGEFADNRMNGYGKLYLDDRLVYEGIFANQQPSGQGIIYYSNGNVYEGSVEAGLPHGKGHLTVQGKPVYDGEWRLGFREGTGRLYDEKGFAYFEGTFAANKRNGYGILRESGSNAGKVVYEGDWKNDIMEGRGKFYSAAGLIEYDGEWKNNKKHGQAIVYKHEKSSLVQVDGTQVVKEQATEQIRMTEHRFSNGFSVTQGNEKIYLGEKDKLGLPHGKGQLYAVNKRKATQAGVLNNLILMYDGEFASGTMSGIGKLYDENQQLIYNGQMSDNLRHGHGVSLEDGRIVYDGQWVNDKESGLGRVYTYEKDFTGSDFEGNTILMIHEGYFRNGSLVDQGNIYKYYGAVKNGMPNGRGTIVMLYDSTDKAEDRPKLPLDERTNGELIYEGAFKDGLREGEGKLYKDNTLIYEGAFVRGLREGKGKAYENNTVYEGPFVQDKREGAGKIYDAYRTLIFEGEFKNDKKNGYGKLYNQYGKLDYEGEYKNDKKHGYGRLYSDGSVYYAGEFVEDKRLEEYLRERDDEE